MNPHDQDCTELAAESEEMPFIVALGASAGGLEALTRLLESVRGLTGMAFIVVQHLSADFKSLMPELLARHTDLEVVHARDGLVPRVDTLYMIEPDTRLTFARGRLRVVPAGREPGKLFLPINELFETLAAERKGECAVVVLSGTGNDGATGLREAKGHGAVTITQVPETARFDGMPRAALATGAVDLVLGPDQILPQLMQMRQEGQAQYFSAAAGHGELVISRILSALRTHAQVDFSYYKPATITRRVDRRMRQLGLSDAREYADRVFLDVAEAKALQQELLIGVTRFLRDAAGFEAVRVLAIPRLLTRATHETLRIWVAGCSTGEEAFSLGMLLQDALDTVPNNRGFRLFATDVDPEAIARASAGEFSDEGVAQLPEELRERYFERRDDRYVVVKALRERLLFSRHDLIQDPPFSHLHMVSCRNLLIYLKPVVQERALRLFGAALRDQGVLWLGPSETIGETNEQFDTLDGRWRLYTARPNRKRQVMVPLPGRPAPASDLQRRSKSDHLRTLLETLLHAQLPPCLVIDENMRLVYRTGELDGLLQVPMGVSSFDVRDLLPGELGILVTALTTRAREAGDVMYREVEAQTARGPRRFDLRARGLVVPDQGRMTALLFENLRDHDAQPDEAASEQLGGTTSRDRVELLESELRQTRESLQATIEELESSNEELQSTNEELIAANEELQSTNEELQSVNEELHTVNAEFSEKLNEVTLLNDDLDRLFASVDVGILLLDDHFAIRRFNATSADYFNILPHDVGRPLMHLSHRLRYELLLDDCVLALRNEATPIRRLVPTSDGMQVQVQIRGHQSAAPWGRRSVVITITDVTGQEDASLQLGRLAVALERSPATVVVIDPEDRIVHVNQAFERHVGRSASELHNLSIYELTPATERERLRDGLARTRAGQRWRCVARSRNADGKDVFELARLLPATVNDHSVVRVAELLTDTFVPYDSDRAASERAPLGPLCYGLSGTESLSVVDERVLELLEQPAAGFSLLEPERYAAESDARVLRKLLQSPDASALCGYRFQVLRAVPPRTVQVRVKPLTTQGHEDQMLFELAELAQAATGFRTRPGDGQT